MREIEIKAKVTNLSKLLDTLASKHISLSKPVKQHDVVYSVPGVKDNAPGSVWLRLRTENDTKTILTLKKQHRGGLDSIEYETEVSDGAEMEKIISLLGFELYSDLIKVRRKAKIGDIEICVDDVRDLGLFIEAEKLSDEDTDGQAVQDELWRLLEELEIFRSNEVFEGYDVLHRKRNNK